MDVVRFPTLEAVGEKKREFLEPGAEVLAPFVDGGN